MKMHLRRGSTWGAADVIVRMPRQTFWSQSTVTVVEACPKTVEKRVTAITQKLALPADHSRGDVNVRVLAVLTYLRSDGIPDQR